MNKIKATLICVTLLTVFSSFSHAEKHALLIGVAAYPNLESKYQLEGPSHDVAALKEVLTGEYGFSPENVATLVDAQANRSAILGALDNLVRSTQPGDLVFLFFSGHGTSGYDPDKHEMGIDPFTGAILPSDFMPGSIAAMLSGMIIGKRDIRPILTRLERDRTVFVVFDACYSGDAIRALKKGKSKAVPFTGMMDEPPAPFFANTLAEPPYPYKNVVYISAASRKEVAEDIGEGLIATGQIRTVDGRPHGVLTDALIRGLKGAANSDSDGTITYGELYQYVRSRVTENFSQTPRLLRSKEADLLIAGPALGEHSPGAFRDTDLSNPESDLKVKTEQLPKDLKNRIAAVKKVKLAETGYDMLVRKENGAYAIYLSNGALLAEIADPEGVVERVRRQVRVKELVGLKFSNQAFNVFLDLIPGKGVFEEKESLGFSIRAEADCHILLIGIDSAGIVNVIYPYTDAELAPLKAGRELRRPEIAEVAGPNFGTEYLKVVAFEKLPDKLKPFMGKGFSPDDPLFRELADMIENGGKAQTTLQVKTTPDSDK